VNHAVIGTLRSIIADTLIYITYMIRMIRKGYVLTTERITGMIDTMRIRIEFDGDTYECDTESSDVKTMEDVYCACRAAVYEILTKVLG